MGAGFVDSLPPDVEGVCRALLNLSAELRLLRAGQGMAPVAPQLAHVRPYGDDLL